MESKIITLVVLSYEKAQILKHLLEKEGVECFLEHQNLIQGAVATGVNVNIKEEDFGKALPILESLLHESLEKRAAGKENSPSGKILLPVDFSDYSKKAADFALELAQKVDAEITVFHTFYDPMINSLPFPDTFMYNVETEELVVEMQEKAEEGMEEFKKYIEGKNEKLGDKKLIIKYELTKGIAEEEILAYSKIYNPWLIIMGTRGKDRKNIDLIGSVTAEVIDMSKHPVLVIPEDFEYKGLDKIKKVLYTTSFDESDFVALDTLEKFLRPLDVEIICVHVESKKHSKWDEVKMAGLNEYMKKTYNHTNVHCDLIDSDDFLEGIEQYVKQHNIDFISITTKRRSFISRMFNPSIARKMLFHSTTPMLVFHS
ncbi:MAG: universal stress protein [Chlorobi bacterium]|nr:universal stress protein [Chlorobiota bacterium]